VSGQTAVHSLDNLAEVGFHQVEGYWEQPVHDVLQMWMSKDGERVRQREVHLLVGQDGLGKSAGLPCDWEVLLVCIPYYTCEEERKRSVGWEMLSNRCSTANIKGATREFVEESSNTV